MPRPKGTPKTGGRQKGSPIKLIRRTVSDLLDSLHCSPVANLAKIANDRKVDVAIRRAANSDLMRYCYPQLKAIELSGPGGGAIPLTSVDPYESIRGELARIAERQRAAGDPPTP